MQDGSGVTESVSDPVADDAHGSPGSRPYGFKVAAAVAAVGASVPGLVMLRIVSRASRLQYGDYWHMLPTWANPDGRLRIRGLFAFQNEHPILVPKYVYWLNYRLFDGSNRTLGVFVIFVVAVQVVLVAMMVRRSRSFGRWAKVLTVITASVLLFARQGAWNYMKAMSGTAWLTANAFLVGALYAQFRGRRRLAIGLALLASASYGTGLAAWPALVAAGTIRDRSLLKQWREGLFGGAVIVSYGLFRPEVPSSWFPAASFSSMVKYLLAVLGGQVAPGDQDLSTWFGLVVVAVGVGLVIATLVRRKVLDGGPWVGLFVYAVISAALISRSRAKILAESGLQSRYMSLSGMAILGVAGLVIVNLPKQFPSYVLLVPLALVVALGGSQQVLAQRKTLAEQDRFSMLFRLDEIDGVKLYFGSFPAVHDLTEQLNHYPFKGFGMGCGLFETSAKISLVSPADRSQVGVVTKTVVPEDDHGVLEIDGWVGTSRGPIDCMVVADEDQHVVGLVAHGSAEEGFTTYPPGLKDVDGFIAMAPRTTQGARVLVRYDGEEAFTEIPQPGP